MEMLSEWYIKQTWEIAGGRHWQFASPAYIPLDNLWELANITQQLYLDLPDRHAHLLRLVPNDALGRSRPVPPVRDTSR